MRVRLQLQIPADSLEIHRNSPRPLSLIVSLILHAITIVFLLWIWRVPRMFRQESLYDQVIAPHQDKIVWYHLRELPKITSQRGADTDARPVPVRISKDVLISDSPSADNKHIVRQPENTPPQVNETPPPNMIAVKKEAEIRPGLPEPLPNLRSQSDVAAMINVPKAVPRAFVRPDPSSASKAPSAHVIVPVPEPPMASPPPGGTGGASNVDALVLSLLPSTAPVPPGGRAGASSGPATTNPGESRGSGLQIAGVTVRPESHPPKTVTPPATAEAAPKPYVALNVAPLQNTFSAPLPPSSRTIPPSIESRFAGRVVYAVIIPMKKIPGYVGDWTIWFAEHQPPDAIGPLAQMRAPLPVRRITTQAPDAPSFPAGRIQFSARIDRLGRVDSISATSRGTVSANDAAIADFKSWEFLPALRNREAVEVDVIVEVYFAPKQYISHDSTGTGQPQH